MQQPFNCGCLIPIIQAQKYKTHYSGEKLFVDHQLNLHHHDINHYH